MPTEIMLLREAEIVPTEEVLENVLGKDLFAIHKELHNILTSPEFNLNAEWNYYKDGKAWLCKVVNKKKTVFWLSAWEGFLKVGFYFTEKTKGGIGELTINEKIKSDFTQTKTIGKLIPLVLNIDAKEQFEDLKEIIRYKKNLK